MDALAPIVTVIATLFTLVVMVAVLGGTEQANSCEEYLSTEEGTTTVYQPGLHTWEYRVPSGDGGKNKRTFTISEDDIGQRLDSDGNPIPMNHTSKSYTLKGKTAQDLLTLYTIMKADTDLWSVASTAAGIRLAQLQAVIAGGTVSLTDNIQAGSPHRLLRFAFSTHIAQEVTTTTTVYQSWYQSCVDSQNQAQSGAVLLTLVGLIVVAGVLLGAMRWYT